MDMARLRDWRAADRPSRKPNCAGRMMGLRIGVSVRRIIFFEDFAEDRKKAYGAVVGRMPMIFAGFGKHGYAGGFPRVGEVRQRKIGVEDFNEEVKTVFRKVFKMGRENSVGSCGFFTVHGFYDGFNFFVVG